MNKVYKLVWSKVRNCWVAVAEIAKSHSKTSNSNIIDKRVLGNKIHLQLQNGYYSSVLDDGNICFVPNAFAVNSAINERPISTDFKITVAAIVKNEAKNVPQWVQAARSCADEIVVVDTGSTDGTVERFADYGIKCFHYKWNDDFASAKNYMISLCHGDWIVLLDGDEWFREGCDVRKAIAKHHNNPVEKAIIADWICLDSSRNNMIMFSGGAVRAFRNHPSIRYFRKVHENLTLGYENFVFEPEFKMYHTGYSGDVNRSKHERNLRIMRTMFDFDNGKVEYPTDWRYVQDTYAGLGNYEKSMEASDRMLEYGVQEYSAASWITRFNVLFAMKANVKRMDKEFEYCFKTTPSVSGFRFLAAIYYLKNGIVNKGLDNYIEGLRMLMGPQDKVALEHTYWRMYLPEASMLASTVYLQNKQAEAALYVCKVSEQYCGKTVWTNNILADIHKVLHNNKNVVSDFCFDKILPVLGFSKKAVLASALASSFIVGLAGMYNPVYAACCNLNGVASNCASGTDATVTGGACNIASSNGTSVSGGVCNIAGCWGYYFNGGKIYYISPSDADSNATITDGQFASVSGGCFNLALGNATSILGGQRNGALGEYSTISGGQCNVAMGCYSNILGGVYNTTKGDYSIIIGGCCNVTDHYYKYYDNNDEVHYVPITCNKVVNGNYQVNNYVSYPVTESFGKYSIAIGGECNSSDGYSAVTVGGQNNLTFGYDVVAVGGECNIVDGSNDVIISGSNNISFGSDSAIISGQGNINYGLNSAIYGGHCNKIDGQTYYGSILGGCGNHIYTNSDTGNFTTGAVIVGGSNSTIYEYGEHSAILGGNSNIACCAYSAVVGGASNRVEGDYGTILGGAFNVTGDKNFYAEGFYSTVSGGEHNVAKGAYTSIFGGCCNIVSGCDTVIFGGTKNRAGDAYSYVDNNGKTNFVQGFCDAINYNGEIGTYGEPGYYSGTVIDVGNNTYPVKEYSAYAAVAVGGTDNKSFGNYSVVSGGKCNFVSACYATITGGLCNKIATGEYFSYEDLDDAVRYIPSNADGINVDEGTYTDNQGIDYYYTYLCSDYASISGGKCNLAVGDYSSISAGNNNKALSHYSSITGGQCNQTEGAYATVSGGQCNIARGTASVVAGGENSRAYADKSVAIGGGITGQDFDSTTATGSVAIGKDATTTRNYEVAIGSVCSPVKLGGSMNVTGTNTVTDGTNTKTWTELLTNSGGGGSSSADIHLYAGTGGTCNAVTANGNTKLALADGTIVIDTLSITGTGSTKVTSDANGTITIGACFADGMYLSGSNNTASGSYSSVSGGGNNLANSAYTAISGGVCNTAGRWGYFYSSYSPSVLKYISPDDPVVDIANGTVNDNGSIRPVIITDGQYATVSGGCFNFALGTASSVTGGQRNGALGEYTTVSGGKDNVAILPYSTVSGGCYNQTVKYYYYEDDNGYNVYVHPLDSKANLSTMTYRLNANKTYTLYELTGDQASIFGGACNYAAGCYSTVSGGNCNLAACDYSTVSGGKCNTASGEYSFVGGGQCNKADYYAAVVVGGANNKSLSSNDAVFGGSSNTSDGGSATVVGGAGNKALGDYSFVAGGGSNKATVTFASAYGGQCNNALGEYSVILGGCSNTTEEYTSTVVGGYSNSACYEFASVFGGASNNTRGYGSSILGGQHNFIDYNGHYATITGGQYNTVNELGANISGGCQNKADGWYSHISGGQCNIAGIFYSYVDNTGKRVFLPSTCNAVQNNYGNYSIIIGGIEYPVEKHEGYGAAVVAGFCNWAGSGTIVGGKCNRTTGNSASILGGMCNVVSACYGSVSGGAFNKVYGDNENFYYIDLDGVKRYVSVSDPNLNLDDYVYRDNEGIDYDLYYLPAEGASISGGYCNIASGCYSTINAGKENSAFAHYSSITGGCSNIAEGDYSTISGGQCNLTKGIASMAVGGENGRAYANKSVAIGGGITGDELDTTVAVNSVAIGSGATTTRNNEVAIGSASAPVKLGGNMNVVGSNTVTDGTTTKTWTQLLNASGGSGGTVTADGLVEKDNTGIVTGGTVWSALNSGRNLNSSDVVTIGGNSVNASTAIGTGSYAWGGQNNIVAGVDSMSIGSDISKISGRSSFAIGSDSANIQGNHSVVLNSVNLNSDDYLNDTGYYNRNLTTENAGSVVVRGSNSTAVGVYGTLDKNNNGEYIWTSNKQTFLDGNATLALGGSENTITGDKAASLGSIHIKQTGEESVSVGAVSSSLTGRNAMLIGGAQNNVRGDFSMAIGSSVSNYDEVSNVSALRFNGVRDDAGITYITGVGSIGLGNYGTLDEDATSPTGYSISRGATISGNNSLALNGTRNSIAGNKSVSVGGESNNLNGTNDLTLGGITNTITGNDSFILGGTNSYITGNMSGVIGTAPSNYDEASQLEHFHDSSELNKGLLTKITGNGSLAIGNYGDISEDTTGEHTYLVSNQTVIDGDNSIVIGGMQNKISSNKALIADSYNSEIKGDAVGSMILNGTQAKIDGVKNAVIISGQCNTISAFGNDTNLYQMIIGGRDNTIQNASPYNYIIGGRNSSITDAEEDTNSYGYGFNMILNSPNSEIKGTDFSTVVGGAHNKIASNNGIIVGARNTIHYGSDRSIITGFDNTIGIAEGSSEAGAIITGSYNNIGEMSVGVITGDYNRLSYGSGAYVLGRNNRVGDNDEGSASAYIVGASNVIKDISEGSVSVFGHCNTVSSGANGTVVGNCNNLDYMQDHIIVGNCNTIGSAYNVAIVGSENIVRDISMGDSVVFGLRNTIGATEPTHEHYEMVALGIGSDVRSDHSTGINGMVDDDSYGGFAVYGTVSNEYGVAISDYSQASGTKAVAIGTEAIASCANSVALGSASVTHGDNTVSFGHSSTDLDHYDNAYGTELKRRLTYVADGINNSDAATVGQLRNVRSRYFGINPVFEEWTDSNANKLKAKYGVTNRDDYLELQQSGMNIGGEGAIGDNSIVIGVNSQSNGNDSIIIGNNIKSEFNGNKAIMIGGNNNDIESSNAQNNNIIIGGANSKILNGSDYFGLSVANSMIASSVCSEIRGSVNSSIFGGKNNTILSSDDSHIIGSNNSLGYTSDCSIIIGYNNWAGPFDDSDGNSRVIIVGKNNGVGAGCSIGYLFGSDNNVGDDSDIAYVYGLGNDVATEMWEPAYAMVYGRCNTVNVQKATNDNEDFAMVVGQCNYLEGSNHTEVYGSDNTLYSDGSNFKIFGSCNYIASCSNAIIFGNCNETTYMDSDYSVYGSFNTLGECVTHVTAIGDLHTFGDDVTNSTAIGKGSSILASCATAINGTVGANGTCSLAVLGIVNATDAIAIGHCSSVTGSTSVAIGKGQTVAGCNSFVLGNNSKVATNTTDVFTLGNINTTASNVVVLGKQSAGSEANTISVGHKATDLDVNGQAYGTVLNRKIVNVAAGTLSASSTDAVIGAQLYATNENIAGFASDINRNKTNIAALNTSVTAALGSVSSTSSLVSTLNDIKADASLNNLTAAGRNVIATAAANAVQEYMAAQQGNTEPATPSAPMMYSGNTNTLNVTNAGNGSLFVGEGSNVNGSQSIAIGVGNQVNANNSGAFGDPSVINADESYVLGNDDTINTGAIGSFVVGNDSISNAKGGLTFGSNNNLSDTAENSIALGNNVNVTGNNSVALGSNSIATEDNIISVGSDTLKRRITNVADGNISENSTDAVTGSQLFVTNEKVKANENAIATKANMDASNINVEDWTTKLGIGTVSEGNTGLVNGGTVYSAIQQVKDNQFIQHNGDTLSIGNSVGGNTISVANNAGKGRVITDVITDPNNASSVANVGYVQSVSETLVNSVNNNLAQMDTKVNKVGANAAAMASLTPASFEGDEKWSLSAGLGNYRGETAGAVGAFYRPAENVLMNVRGSFGNNENMIGAAVSVSLSKGDIPGVTKRQMAATINKQATAINTLQQNQQAILQAREQDQKRIAELEAMVLKMAEQMNVNK